MEVVLSNIMFDTYNLDTEWKQPLFKLITGGHGLAYISISIYLQNNTGNELILSEIWFRFTLDSEDLPSEGDLFGDGLIRLYRDATDIF